MDPWSNYSIAAVCIVAINKRSTAPSSIMPPRTRSKQNKASRFRKHVRLVEPSQPNVGESEPEFDLDEFIVDVEKENTTTGNPRSEGERIEPWLHREYKGIFCKSEEADQRIYWIQYNTSQEVSICSDLFKFGIHDLLYFIHTPLCSYYIPKLQTACWTSFQSYPLWWHYRPKDSCSLCSKTNSTLKNCEWNQEIVYGMQRAVSCSPR